MERSLITTRVGFAKMKTKIDTKQISELLEKIGKDLEKAKGVRVGVIGNQSYPDKEVKLKDGTVRTYKGAKVSDVAIWNEYGTSKIPPRPFLRKSLKNQKKWAQFVQNNWDVSQESDKKLNKIAMQLGAMVEGDIKKSIGSDIPPPNSAYTLRQKAPKTKTLINTATLMGSIHYEVLK